MKVPTLSATQLSLFRECPLCFWMAVRQQAARPRGAFPSLPRGMDTVLRGACAGYRAALPPFLQDRLPGALTSLPIGTITVPFLGWKMSGRLDEALMIDAQIAPVDFKTRASLPPVGYGAQYYQVQMDVYAALLTSQGYVAAPDAYLVYLAPRALCDAVAPSSDVSVSFAVHVEALPVSPQRAWTLFEAAVACAESGVPPEGNHAACEYCAFRSSR